MTPSKQLLKDYLQGGGLYDADNDTFYDYLPKGEVVIDGISNNCVGGVRVTINITQEGDDFAEEFQVKILFIDLLAYIYDPEAADKLEL